MGKYVVKEGKAGFRFNLVATNGQVIGSSEIYKAKASCQRTVCLVFIFTGPWHFDRAGENRVFFIFHSSSRSRCHPERSEGSPRPRAII